MKQADQKIEKQINLEEIEDKINVDFFQNQNNSLVTLLLEKDSEIQRLKKTKIILKAVCFIGSIAVILLSFKKK